MVRIDGAEYLYFVGTGYLGLQAHPEVIRAACEAARQYGIHSATSRAGFGNTPPTLSVERRAAEFFGCEAAFYYPSGYAGNSILLRAIESCFDALFIDEYSHYCEFEAAAQSGRPLFRFHHRDASDLADNLHKHVQPGGRPLVMTDGVFSVRGTIAPLGDYVASLAGYPGAGFLVDDAHGVGVLGRRGRGTLEHFGLFDGIYAGSVNGDASLLPFEERARVRPVGATAGPVAFLCGTLSKALGGYGGIIPGSEAFIEHARRCSHWYDGATSPPAPVTAASARAIELVQADPDLRTRLWANVRRLKDGLRAMGFDVGDTPVPIICLEVGDAENMRRIQRELMRRGIAVAYMAAYSGLSSAGGLRIAVFATHTEQMIQQLLAELSRVV
jgi:8-amino-7-oxononanoate synthase